ncbi:MAG: anthranilate synthase component I family protein [Bacteroidales bacterium]|nr:anthranilate synthase component I family protein [Bacteroidales bacterium]
MNNIHTFKNQLAQWCSGHQVFAFHCSNGFHHKQTNTSLFPGYDILAATGAQEMLVSEHGLAFNALKSFISEKKDWFFGTLAYDLKNETEKLTSSNKDFLGFQDMLIFRPELVFRLINSKLEILYYDKFTENEIEAIYHEIINIKTHDIPVSENSIVILQRISQDSYFKKFNRIKDHIARGDIFEMNFCMEFYAENAVVHPLPLYLKLTGLSPSPFSCLYRFNDKYIISSSPERYLTKTGRIIVSQPMKGTAKRGASALLDQKQVQFLKNNMKELSENIMIVDLVRNDLSKVAVKDSVAVEELCGIYTYATVHQMVSTIKCRLSPEFDAIDAIARSFPMGSMTGAPKVRAMQLIEEYEETKRGIYSGAAGYFTPELDFDFNVLIRTILYNETNRYLSFTTGGAITASSEVLSEYEECQLKASALKMALNQSI